MKSRAIHFALDKTQKEWYNSSMTNKTLKLDNSVRLQMLENEKKEITEKLEHYEFNGPSLKVQELEDELFEVNDTIKKLG